MQLSGGLRQHDSRGKLSGKRVLNRNILIDRKSSPRRVARGVWRREIKIAILAYPVISSKLLKS